MGFNALGLEVRGVHYFAVPIMRIMGSGVHLLGLRVE